MCMKLFKLTWNIKTNILKPLEKNMKINLMIIKMKTSKKEFYINEKLNNLRLHKLIRKIELVHLLWDFDAVSLYPSAMWDRKSIFFEIETGYAFTKKMNDDLVNKFNTRSFTQGSAILKVKYYNPTRLIVQHLPVEEKVKKIEINRMRNG